jgi:hypothetical protein
VFIYEIITNYSILMFISSLLYWLVLTYNSPCQFHNFNKIEVYIKYQCSFVAESTKAVQAIMTGRSKIPFWTKLIISIVALKPFITDMFRSIRISRYVLRPHLMHSQTNKSLKVLYLLIIFSIHSFPLKAESACSSNMFNIILSAIILIYSSSTMRIFMQEQVFW